ncbi:MAG TPA: chemotaxis protein CheB [Telluria sp.]|jgi:two-component system chemotaxis response regulator CheB
MKLVVIGASAGGVEALSKLLGAIPADFSAAILIVMHIGEHKSILPTLLARHCALPVAHAQHHQAVLAGTVVIAPPDLHLLVEKSTAGLRTVLTHGPKENHSRPAVDTLFRSAAIAGGSNVVGVVLTGYLDDGTAGLQAIKACGGLAIVQDPGDAIVPDMPQFALDHVQVDFCLPLDQIATALSNHVGKRPSTEAVNTRTVPEWVQVENNFASGAGNMTQLQKIASPSEYSCPECGGALFQVNNSSPCRFRCHTGHSYTMLTLLEQQEQSIEASLASALRALQEKESLAEQLAAQFIGRSLMPEPGYAALAKRARADAAVLRPLLARRDTFADLTIPATEDKRDAGEGPAS